MIKLKDFQQISSKLSMEIMGMESDDMSEEIVSVGIAELARKDEILAGWEAFYGNLFESG